ncbi:hypothetical protein VW23_014345 [Devosia insulae DS-56]|uniref:General secretion pathway protein GspM n=1 Tax=Devosia insulae DS-56 TaxID=1116389 RepID=A0A1E5XTC9_9HYPH|nr:GspMb/PilO family protein [Devosia insulae]OEO31853.1 hypothetical protein VW23_014345 [Devosia insulae DS-56]
MRNRIVLLLVVAVAVFLAGWAVERVYLAPGRAADERIADLSTQLAALRERELSARREQAALTGAPVQPQADLVARADSATAGTQFQEYARAAVAEADGLALSSQVLVSEVAEGYAKVSVLLRMRIAERQLLEFARQVETESPPIVFDSLELRLMPVSPDSRVLDVTATLGRFYGGADAR